MTRRLIRATALFVLVSWAWLSAPQALAQLSSLIVTITSPANGSTVSGTVTVTASVTIIGMLTVDEVQFKLDGANLGAADTSAPYSIPWNTATASNGSHTLTAVARDNLGIQWTSSPVTVTVSNDTTPPTVTINQAAGQVDPASTAPINFTAVFSEAVSGFTGTDVTISGTAGGTKTATVTGGPSTYTVAVSGMTSGGTVTATIGAGVATDAAGNANTASTSTDNTVTFTPPDTTPPTVSLTAPANGATVSGTITVSASASDNVGVVGVQFKLDGANLGTEDAAAPYSRSWDTTTASNGSHTLTAVARDAAGNSTTATTITVTVSNDTSPPTVAITAPANGATVSGTISVTASASDNVGVVGVRFKLDGANLGSEDTSAPYSRSWDTTTASNGSHTLTAVARDAAGNSSTAATITVTVSNGPPPDTTPPTVSLTAPANGATVSGTTNVTANASDNVGVVGVQFQLDGANLGPEDTAAPYAVSWNTTTASDGSHTLTAVARDAAGNSTTSVGVTVTVSNSVPDTTPPTVSLTAPANGATVSGTTTVSATASDNVGVTQVEFFVDGSTSLGVDTTAPYAVSWDTTTASNGTHSLTAVARDAAGNSTTSAAVTVTVSNGSASSGDVLVALDQDNNPLALQGVVKWFSPDGTLRQILTGPSRGQASSLNFDAAGNIYVPHWCTNDGNCAAPNNRVERWDPAGTFLDTFGSGYNCNPSSITFDSAGNMYVGQADCSGDILKFNPAGTLVESFDVITGARGTDHIDLAPDGCTMFYASRDKNIYRYNVCTGSQLTNFNLVPLPGLAAFHVRVLPDGSVLVADWEVVVRLDAAGNQLQTYSLPGVTNIWGGLDYVGDGTFWASNAATDEIVRFDLQSGAIVSRFNTGDGGGTAAGLAVKR